MHIRVLDKQRQSWKQELVHVTTTAMPENKERFRVLAATRAAQRGVAAAEMLVSQLLKRSSSQDKFLDRADIAPHMQFAKHV